MLWIGLDGALGYCDDERQKGRVGTPVYYVFNRSTYLCNKTVPRNGLELYQIFNPLTAHVALLQII